MLAEVPPIETIGRAALRGDVLDGRYFGPGCEAAAGKLSDLLSRDDAAATLVVWFGPDAIRLLRQPGALRAAIDRDIAAIDDLLGTQVDAILHHPRLAMLEGRWRGLKWLARTVDHGARIKLRVLNVSWAEISRDLDRALEFDQSALFRRIYEDEFGTPGGEPFGLLLIDHEVRHEPAAGLDDVATLKLLSSVAAAAFVPMVLAASPALLGADDFQDLAVSMEPASLLRSPSHARWRSLRALEDSRFLCIALPRVLARAPWQDDPARPDGFRYAEYAPTARCRVWMSAGFAFASCVARAFGAHAWPADVRGVETDREGGGVVLDLPLEPYGTDPGDTWTRPSVDLVLTAAQEQALIEAGIVPLNAIPFSVECGFGAVCSLQQPQRMTTESASSNARISAQINSMLCVGRFAHYIKVMGRDMIGSLLTADAIERRLQQWLNTYVNSNLIGGRDSRAKAPLVNGIVKVTERLGQPGVFGCIIQLQPHFQLDDVSSTFRLVTELSAPGRG